MAWFLVKSDPDDYSLDDLARDGTTTWDGVHSFAAIGFIKQMQVGDMVLIYHSLTEKAIVGLAEVSVAPFLNTKDPRFSWAVTLQFVRRFTKSTPLSVIKSDPALADFGLVKQSRLSVMPVPPAILKRLQEINPEIQA